MKKYKEVFISIRSKPIFVILSIDDYERLKEAKLEKIIKEAEQDYKDGRVIKETAEKHFKRLEI